MSKKPIELFKEKSLLAEKIELTPTSLEIVGEMSDVDYELVWSKLAYWQGGTLWWIGDLARKTPKKHGRYDKLIADSGLDKETVRKARYICDNIQTGVRTPFLSFQHHQLVAPMEPADQRMWLQLAVDNEWTVKKLRDAIRTAKPLIISPLPKGVYNVVYADPPWRYDFAVSPTRKIENQYPTMSINEICTMPLPSIASDAVLLLWSPSPKLREALMVIEAWGFEYKTNMVWVKDKIGMGYYARQMHELLLIAGKGKSIVPNVADRPPSVISAPRRKHSAKPQEAYDVIERMYPNGSKIELFARKERDGWTSWIND